MKQEQWDVIIENDNIKGSEINSNEIKGYMGLYNRCIKRVIGFCIALVFCVILIPFYLVVAVAVAVETGFPVFYRADRGGYKEKSFRIFKFRSMIKNADKVGGGTTALNDPRVTRVGAILRKTKLDETPQLFNILKGDMCFIGPRPELPRYTSDYKNAEKLILQVRPGITDYSSIRFINLDEIVGSENADEMYERYILKKKNKLRIMYADQVSLTADVEIFFSTIWHVLKKIGRIFVRSSR